MSAAGRSAETSRGPSPRRQLLIAAAGLLAGLGAHVLLRASDHFPDRRLWAVFGPLIAWSFVGTGLFAWRRRPESRFGPLLVVLGFCWCLAALPAANAPLMFSVGLVLSGFWGPVLAHVLASFPTGRLDGRRLRALVIAGYVIVPLAPLPALLVTDARAVQGCDGGCPRNVLMIARDDALGDVLAGLGGFAVLVLSVTVVVVLAARWRAAGASERRALAPIYTAGGAMFAFVVASAVVPALLPLTFAAFAATPFAFLAGLARADVSHSRAIRSLLARLPDLPERGDLRDALARALGDPGLRLAFWVPERGRYVDADGAPADLPEPGDPALAVTEVERDGRRVAAIVHARALVEDEETVRAAGAAAALLLENRRLEAELRAHIVELRASRARLVAAGDAERRRLERDLHDGAQSRLVALALSLRIGRGQLEDGSPAAPLIDAATNELKQSLDELRELARGIHPAVLSERGLEPAVRSLAMRAPVPVELAGETGGRLPAAVETAAYFVVCEGLTNVAKYARARRATVRLERGDGRLLVEISDDGVGGADPAAGSGLRGLTDRVAALDGALEVSSPPGGGTRLRVRLPCGPAQ
jgi:signal transduction histidine kinase